jgi:hypothetical protein
MAMPSVRRIVSKANHDLSHGFLPTFGNHSEAVAANPKSAPLPVYRDLLSSADFNHLSDRDQQEIASIKLNPTLSTLEPDEYRIWRHLARVRLGLSQTDNLTYSLSVSEGGVDSINVWGDTIHSITLASGATIYNAPLPSVWRLGVEAVFPLIGFSIGYVLGSLVPWGILSCAVWIFDGFSRRS